MNVVIAEDDYRVSLIHEDIVNNANGLNVVGKALNGIELKELLSLEDVDLILLDIYFPDAHGSEIIAEIRTKYPHIDIIVISASNSKADLLTAKRYGVYHYLIKPVSIDDIKNILSNYLKDIDWFADEAAFNTIDAEYFLTGSSSSKNVQNPPSLPSGIDNITLEKIVTAMKNYDQGITIEEVCTYIGVSRTTARRYLEYLVSMELASTRLSYGEVGRPERKYTLN